MTIGKKLILSVASLLALMLILSLSSLRAIDSLSTHLDVAANNTARKIAIAGRMQKSVAMMRWSVRGFMHSALMKDTADVEKSRAAFEKHADDLDKACAEIKALLVTEKGKAAVASIQQNLKQWRVLEKDVLALTLQGKFDEANQLRMGNQSRMAEVVNLAVEELISLCNKLLSDSSASGASDVQSSRWIAFALLGLAMVVGAIVLTVVRNINAALRQLAAEIGAGAEQVASASMQVASSAQSLAQGSSEQAASLEETSASSEEIHSMSRKNAESAQAASGLMAQSQARFNETNGKLEEMIVAMDEINASSTRISKIIKVIDEISFQTNILALNAAVEAARAGEAGMGFAVVADEVRNLAQRCANAAKDTAELIEKSIAKSNDGKAKVDEVTGAIRTIMSESTRVKTLVEEVNVGSREQNLGIQEVAKAITQMESVTQTTAAGAEESAAASQELTAQSSRLRDVSQVLAGMVGQVDSNRGHAGPGKHAGSRKSARFNPVEVVTGAIHH